MNYEDFEFCDRDAWIKRTKVENKSQPIMDFDLMANALA